MVLSVQLDFNGLACVPRHHAPRVLIHNRVASSCLTLGPGNAGVDVSKKDILFFNFFSVLLAGFGSTWRRLVCVEPRSCLRRDAFKTGARDPSHLNIQSCFLNSRSIPRVQDENEYLSMMLRASEGVRSCNAHTLTLTL